MGTEPKWIMGSQLIPAEVAAQSPLEEQNDLPGEAESAPPIAEASDVRQNLDPCGPLLVDDSFGDVGGCRGVIYYPNNWGLSEIHVSMFFFSEYLVSLGKNGMRTPDLIFPILQLNVDKGMTMSSTSRKASKIWWKRPKRR